MKHIKSQSSPQVGATGSCCCLFRQFAFQCLCTHFMMALDISWAVFFVSQRLAEVDRKIKLIFNNQYLGILGLQAAS